jgi:hypothetical protein
MVGIHVRAVLAGVAPNAATSGLAASTRGPARATRARTMPTFGESANREKDNRENQRK